MSDAKKANLPNKKERWLLEQIGEGTMSEVDIDGETFFTIDGSREVNGFNITDLAQQLVNKGWVVAVRHEVVYALSVAGEAAYLEAEEKST